MNDSLEGEVEPPIRDKRAVAERAAEAIAASAGYGGIVTERDFHALFGVNIPRGMAHEKADRLRLEALELWKLTKDRLLTHHKMALCALGRRRWVIVVPQQQGNHAEAVAREAIAKGLGEAARIASHVNTDVLDDEQRRRLTDTQNRIGTARMFATMGMRGKELPSGAGRSR